jgi:hypothetical protein
MLKNPAAYERTVHSVRPNSFPSPLSPVLLLDASAGRIARELWWTNQEFSPVVISPWFSMLIYHLEDDKQSIVSQLFQIRGSVNFLWIFGELIPLLDYILQYK